MATQPLTYLEKKWAACGYSGSQRFEAATQTKDRQFVPDQNQDIHKQVSPLGRRTLASIGRWLYTNNPVVKAAIDEMAENAATIRPLFRGLNKDWGHVARDWMEQHDKICCVEGWPYTAQTWRENLVRGGMHDGTAWTLLTETPTGYPQIQSVPDHRIGSISHNPTTVRVRLQDNQMFIGDILVEDAIATDPVFSGTEYKTPIEFDARYVDGVIVNQFNRPLAYRVFSENQNDGASYRDISARDLFPSFVPQFTGQVRGFSLLGCCLFGFKSLKEWRDWEMVVQKMHARLSFQIYNEEGAADPARLVLNRNSKSVDSNGEVVKTSSVNMDGVQAHFMRSNSGDKIEPVISDRPSQNQQNFNAETMRETLLGMGQSYDFLIDPNKSGAAMRIVIERMNKTFSRWRTGIVEPGERRFDQFRIAKSIPTYLEDDVDWWRWSYQQGQRKLTADAKYDSDVTLQELRAGLTSRDDVIVNNGGDPLVVDEQNEISARRVLASANKLMEEFNVPLSVAMSLLVNTNPQGLNMGYSQSVSESEQTK